MKSGKGFPFSLTPYQLLVIGYITVTLIGAVILSLPISSAHHTYQPFIDSLFISASGISTTGLVVVDIGTYYNTFGQVVLLIIFQIGGIGYMTFIMFFTYVFGLKMSLTTISVAKESISVSNYRILGRFFILVLVSTIIFEAAGAIALFIVWIKEYSIAYALYLGLFHSVSAFCTAGFGIFNDSMMKYCSNITINITIIFLSIIGGLGFIVLYDIYVYTIKRIKKIRPRKLALHTKFVLIITGALNVIGTLLIFVSEKWPSAINNFDRLMISLFQTVSASTTDGYNSIDIGKMTPISLTFIIILMFIGASPGSTGGGIKTSTIGLIIFFILSQLRGREKNVNVFKREIPDSSIYKAFGVFFWFMIIMVVDLLIMCVTENATYLQILFEITSALGNTGLSMGITSNLSMTGKIVLIMTMFIGRVGPLTIGFFLVGREKPIPYRYAEEDIFIG